MIIKFQRATDADIPTLAEMNQQLIIDESSANTMTLEQLERRMQNWLDDGRKAVLILNEDGDILGYMLYWNNLDEYYPYEDSIYIRQFFIKRNYRRRGIGKIAFESIVRDFFPQDKAITLDVLERNPEAKLFWLRQGFNIYHTTLRREPAASLTDILD